MTGKRTTEPAKRATPATGSRGGGRPKFDGRARADLLRAVEAGATFEEAATAQGFSRSTVQRHARQSSGFRSALDAALEVGARNRDSTTRFTSEVREMFLDLMREGMKPKQAARQLGLDPKTTAHYIETHDDFRFEVRSAMAEALDIVEHVQMKDAQTPGAANQRAREFVLKNRRPRTYRDTRLIGLGGIGEDDKPTGPVEVDLDEKRARTRRLGAALLEAGPAFAALAVRIVDDDEAGS